MKQTFKESLWIGTGSCEHIKSVALAYAPKRECSLHKAVHQIIPELWIKKISPRELCPNSNAPEKHVRMMLSKKEILQWLEDSAVIIRKNMINSTWLGHTLQRLNIFIIRYSLNGINANKTKWKCFSTRAIDRLTFWNKSEVLILSSEKILLYQKHEFVLRYHVPNKFKYPKGYAHHLLFMFYHFRDEWGIMLRQPPSYSPKLSDQGVL